MTRHIWLVPLVFTHKFLSLLKISDMLMPLAEMISNFTVSYGNFKGMKCGEDLDQETFKFFSPSVRGHHFFFSKLQVIDAEREINF